MPNHLALVFVAAAATSPAGMQRDARVDIQDRYNRASAAAVAARTASDIDAIHAWLDTPDCLYSDAGRPARKWAEQRRYAVHDLETPLKSFTNQIQTLEQSATTAVATTLVKGVARIVDERGQFGARGAAHDVETTATVRDVWVRTEDGWRRKSHTKIVANRVTAVDGKTTQ